MTARSGQDEVVGDRTAADLGCGLAMLAYVRGRLCASEGEDFRIPDDRFSVSCDLVRSDVTDGGAAPRGVVIVMEPPVDGGTVVGTSGRRCIGGRSRSTMGGWSLPTPKI
jgi:hypothetical protein